MLRNRTKQGGWTSQLPSLPFPPILFPRLILRKPDLHVNEGRLAVLPFVNLLHPSNAIHQKNVWCLVAVDQCAVCAAAEELDWEGFVHLQNSTVSSSNPFTQRQNFRVIHCEFSEGCVV